MASALKTNIQRQAFSIVLWQLICVIVVSMIAFLAFSLNVKIGLSVLAGGLAYGIANLIFVWRVFRYAGAQEMNQFAAAFMAGEAMKLILSAILFLVIVKYLPVSLLSVLVGFISAIIAFWFVCIWKFSKQERRQQSD